MLFAPINVNKGGGQVGSRVGRPYFLVSKGPRPEGVYIRLGVVSVPASDVAISA